VVLHTLAASPASAAFADCLRVLRAGDAVLLLGNGVYAACDRDALESLAQSGAQLYLLEDDARAAGVTAETDCASRVDMDAFVALTERFPKQLAWY
tara:strand:+ start:639 stop:926 length:288 start_codon:yes stop_codon:yes gene_type:complete